MRPLALLLTLVLGALASGCNATYTSIRKHEGGEYLVTRTKVGFFSTYGTLYACKPSADGGAMACQEIASP